MWHPLSTPPARTDDYLIGWWATYDGEPDEPCFVHQVASYHTERGWNQQEARHAQFWQELPLPPPLPLT